MMLGIMLGNWIQEVAISIFVLIIAFVVSTIWLFRPSFLRLYKLRFIGGILIVLLFFLFGYQLIWFHSAQHFKNHYSTVDSSDHFVVLIKSPLIEKKNSYKSLGKLIAAYQHRDTIPQAVSGDVLLYFEKKNKPNIQYGDEILMVNSLEKIKPPGNPNEFDYSDYLRKQNIYDQAYLRPTDWIKTFHSTPNIILKFSLHIRNILLDILKSYHFNQSEFAIASAMLVGYDEYLDQDLRQLYAGSGAMHILCVSGLHVGIIVLMFSALFSFIKKIRWGKYLYTFMLIATIWLYALVTGLSPSVFRAAIMFSFISFGNILNRKTSTYNSLGASAMVLLLYNPFMLFYIGFQLSYLAVLAILYLQPHFSKIIHTKNWLFKNIRDLMAVSLAAQIGTFPLAIYYFHQFPNLFFITNLFVIPLSFAILIVGFASIFISLFSLGTSFLGLFSTKILYVLLWSLNDITRFIATMPFAVSRDLYFTPIDTIFVYTIIFFLCWGFISKNIKGVFVAAFFMITILSLNIWLRFSAAQQSHLVIYQVPKHSMIEVSKARKSIILMDTVLLADSLTFKRYCKEYELHNRIKDTKNTSFERAADLQYPFFNYSKNIIAYENKLILIVDKRNLLPEKSAHLKFDYVLFRNNPSLSLKTLDSLISFDSLIMDGSNSFWKLKKWKEEADHLHLPYWDTKEKGAVVMTAPPLSLVQ
jgi:competence protein ComEC